MAITAETYLKARMYTFLLLISGVALGVTLEREWGAKGRVGHINGKYNAGCVLTLTEIGGGAPLLTLFEKWLAELLAL